MPDSKPVTFASLNEGRFVVVQDCHATARRPRWTPITRGITDLNTALTYVTMQRNGQKRRKREVFVVKVLDASDNPAQCGDYAAKVLDFQNALRRVTSFYVSLQEHKMGTPDYERDRKEWLDAEAECNRLFDAALSAPRGSTPSTNRPA